jgi:transposase
MTKVWVRIIANFYRLDGIIDGMNPYSIDLRERVIASVKRGECTIPAAAKRYQVSEPSIERWLARKRKTKSCAPYPHAGGRARKLAPAQAVIRAAVRAQADATLQELCERVEQQTKIASNPSMMFRELTSMKLPLKKNRYTPANGTRHGSNGNAVRSKNTLRSRM